MDRVIFGEKIGSSTFCADSEKQSPMRSKIVLNEELNRGKRPLFGAAEQQVISRRQSLNSRHEQTLTFLLPAHMKKSNKSTNTVKPSQLIIKGPTRELKKFYKTSYRHDRKMLLPPFFIIFYALLAKIYTILCQVIIKGTAENFKN